MFYTCSLKSNKSIALFAAVMALASCAKPASQGDRSAELEARLQVLEGEVGNLRNELYQKTYKTTETVWLTPTEKGFGFLETEAGTLAFSVEGIHARGDGSEVDVRIGNATSATITGLKFHAAWGPVGSDDAFVQGRYREADKDISGAILPGSWNRQTLLFAGIPPAQMGRIVLSKPEIGSIRLNTM
ncbi:DUF3251 domain-containing protein [Sphingomonas beigongshangi]|uniref:DUF3251 domain-containing protein n=1 Tax=Sphingomonas beigongshangi TaxID=2782540 RepID=UPI00193C4A67|nr:DUF3251 domain-containing protein [Sphingomonas beigongshangi]